MAAPELVTPEAVALDLDVATLGSRGVAYAIDLSIVGTCLVLVAAAQATLGFGGFVPGWAGLALLLLLAFAVTFGYPVLFETLWRGRTPGKAAMGLRVVTVEGGPVGIRHATIRAVLGVIELLSTFGAVAVLASFASPRSQRLGDLVAGTLVVRERRAVGQPQAVVFHPPPGTSGFVATLDVSGLPAREYAVVRDALRRAPMLAPELRAEVFAGLARRLVDRVRPAPPAQMPAEVFVACVAAAVQAARPATVEVHETGPQVATGRWSPPTGGRHADAWFPDPATPDPATPDGAPRSATDAPGAGGRGFAPPV